jgi:YD repeat-containing protein
MADRYGEIPRFKWDNSGEHDEVAARLLEDVAAAVPKVEKDNGLVARVTYPDGKSRQFEYDEQGKLKAIVQPGGEKWTQKEAGLWVSNKGRTFSGEIRVGSEGEYVTVDSAGITRSYAIDGSKKVFDFRIDEIKNALTHFDPADKALKADFDKLDSNADGFLSDTELIGGIGNSALGRDTRLAAAGLRLGYKTVLDLSSEDNRNDLGISRNDLKAYGKAIRESEAGWLERNLEYINFGAAGAALLGAGMQLAARSNPGLALSVVSLNVIMGMRWRSERLASERLFKTKAELMQMIHGLK